MFCYHKETVSRDFRPFCAKKNTLPGQWTSYKDTSRNIYYYFAKFSLMFSQYFRKNRKCIKLDSKLFVLVKSGKQIYSLTPGFQINSQVSYVWEHGLSPHTVQWFMLISFSLMEECESFLDVFVGNLAWLAMGGVGVGGWQSAGAHSMGVHRGP